MKIKLHDRDIRDGSLDARVADCPALDSYPASDNPTEKVGHKCPADNTTDFMDKGLGLERARLGRRNRQRSAVCTIGSIISFVRTLLWLGTATFRNWETLGALRALSVNCCRFRLQVTWSGGLMVQSILFFYMGKTPQNSQNHLTH